MNFVHKFNNIFALYRLVFPIISSNIFSLAAFARLRFIPHLEMKACNVFYQLHLYIYIYFCFLRDHYVIIPD